MWIAVLFTVLASAGNSIGKVMQKQGTKGLPQLAFNLKVIGSYLASPTWVFGFVLDVFGALAMLKAVSEAPVSVVQPVSGCGLAILAVFSHFYLHEPLDSLDWLGVALAGAGTIGIGIAGEEQTTLHLKIVRLIWFILWAMLLFGALEWWTSLQKMHIRSHEYAGQMITPPNRTGVIEEVIAGMEAGTCFGMAAVVSRMGFMLADNGQSKMCVPIGILIGICCSAAGFFCQTKGLKEGRAVVVSTCAAVASIVTGVLVGMLVLGEALPISSVQRTFLLIGWLLIIFGVILLMGSYRIGLMLPRSIRRIMRLKAHSHKSNPPRLVQYIRRESSPSTVGQLFTPPKPSPTKASPY